MDEWKLYSEEDVIRMLMEAESRGIPLDRNMTLEEIERMLKWKN